MAENGPYSTVLPMATNKPAWLSGDEADRVAAYTAYDDMYASNPGTYQLMIRGTDDLPVYMPTAKTLINTLARYVGRDLKYAVDPTVGTPASQELAIRTMDEFFKREKVLSKFSMSKKEWLRRGDHFWYLHADTSKAAGSRISLKTIDPAMVFLIKHPDDEDRIVGYRTVEQVKVGDAVKIQVQKWLKNTSPDHPAYVEPPEPGAPPATPSDAPVVYVKERMDVEGWDDPEQRKNVEQLAEFTFPVGIVQLPIYHWRNNPETGQPYGFSELRSLERVIAAVNQAVTDEDLALALAGLGVYKSSAGGPVDANGQETDWTIGPGDVVEDPDFTRVNGVGSIQPSQDHIKYLESSLDRAVGITDVTKGEVSVDIAESGVALSIRMAPTVDAANEKDLEIKDVFDQLLYDLKFWFRAFEGIDFTEASVTCTFGSKLPENRADKIKELLDLQVAGIVSIKFVQDELQKKYGFVFPEDMAEQMANELAAADPYAARTGDVEGLGGEFEEPAEEEEAF